LGRKSFLLLLLGLVELHEKNSDKEVQKEERSNENKSDKE
jgi:hypothetical protein